MNETHELGGSLIAVDRATPKVQLVDSTTAFEDIAFITYEG